jgi:pantetheine-phosphate adenylyltransferase
VGLALCPGSFDPPTNGHVDVITRAARHFEALIVAVTANPSKRPLFSLSEREEMLGAALAGVPNVEIASFDGLLVDYARARGVRLVVKGLRAISDFEYELQMAEMNSALAPDLDTVFIVASSSWGFVSSSLVKEVAAHGGDVGLLVPAGVAHALKTRFGDSAAG